MSRAQPTHKQTNPTLDDDDIRRTTRDEFDSLRDLLDYAQEQPTVEPLNEKYQAGTHGFRVYKTDFPIIRPGDIEPGVLLYQPVGSVRAVYEITSEPYEENRSSRVDTIMHYLDATGETETIRSTQNRLFTLDLMDRMTLLQPATIQQTLD